MNRPLTMRTGRAGRGGGGAGRRPGGREVLVLPVARDVAGAPERARGVDVRVAMVLKLVGAARDWSPGGRVSGDRSPDQQTHTEGRDPRGEQDGADAQQHHGPVGLRRPRPIAAKKKPAGMTIAASRTPVWASHRQKPLSDVASPSSRQTSPRVTRTPAWACPAR